MLQKVKTAIDRIEGDFLVCCDDDTMKPRLLPRTKYPHYAPNDILLITEENGEVLSIERLPNETEARLQAVNDRMHRLFKHKKS